MEECQTFDVIAYVDGACKGNPGIGGWGVRLVVDGINQDMCGGESFTTNNKMELVAAIEALKNSPVKPKRIKIITDSQYTMKGITDWIKNWKKNGWRTSKREPVKNAELWQELDSLLIDRDVTWVWIRGHNGHAGNEKADELANRGIYFTIKRGGKRM